MKKIFSNIRTLAALLMAGAAFAACSNEENAIEQPVSPAGEQVYTFTIKATNSDASTRALKLETSGALTAYWTNGDELKVYNVTKNAALTGTLTASNASGATATFSGSLTGTIEKNDVLTLSYHQPAGFSDYAAQTGTLASAAGRDYATANVTVASVTSGNITTTADASFTTQTAVLKLTMKDGASNKINATSLTLSATMTVPVLGEKTEEIATFDLSGDPYSEEDNGPGVLYFALPSASIVAEYLAGRLGNASFATTIAGQLPTTTLTYNATYNSDTYVATKVGYTFLGGTYYAGELTMTKQDVQEELLSITVTDQTGGYIGDHTFYYLQGETWADALQNHSEKNAGWECSGNVRYNGNEILYSYEAPNQTVNARETIVVRNYFFPNNDDY